MDEDGLRDLPELLLRLEPEQKPGEFVVVSTTSESTLPALATVVEEEGTTLVLERHTADAFRLEYRATYAWITLTVNSSLEAVGLTAAVARALAGQGIPCNVLAGFHHDHLLVPHARARDALAALAGLSSAGGIDGAGGSPSAAGSPIPTLRPNV